MRTKIENRIQPQREEAYRWTTGTLSSTFLRVELDLFLFITTKWTFILLSTLSHPCLMGCAPRDLEVCPAPLKCPGKQAHLPEYDLESFQMPDIMQSQECGPRHPGPAHMEPLATLKTYHSFIIYHIPLITLCPRHCALIKIFSKYCYSWKDGTFFYFEISVMLPPELWLVLQRENLWRLSAGGCPCFDLVWMSVV